VQCAARSAQRRGRRGNNGTSWGESAVELAYIEGTKDAGLKGAECEDSTRRYGEPGTPLG
jgi:hypothetical protein